MQGQWVKGWHKINFAIGFVGMIERHKLRKAAKDVSKAQDKTLRGILKYAKDTEYGKEHKFSEILKAKSPDELFKAFSENVKVNDYEDLRPFINRHMHGEENILFPGKPQMYATTSGTTSEPKWIPITHKYFSDVYGRMNKMWLSSLISANRHSFAGGVVSIVGKAIEGYAPDGTVYGSVSGVSFTNCPEFVKVAYSSPAEVFEIKDYRARYYTIMRFGIEYNSTVLITANPSTIVEMQNNVNEFYEDYINDIENGTLKEDLDIPQHVREALKSRMKPNHARAQELRDLKAKYGEVLPKHYWPDMAVVNTWHCGNTKIYLDKIKNSFPASTKQIEFGYFASECRAGLVLNEGEDTTLFAHMHYFEFIKEEDLDNPNPTFLPLSKLEKGKRYCMYVTTCSGLYRYNMNDLVQVTGFDGTIPMIQFIQKVNGIITLTGEKLHERQFIKAVHDAETELNMKTKFFIGFADADISGYKFFYEFADQSTSQEQAETFTKTVDANLKKINIEYDAKRASFRVKDPLTYRLEENAFEKFKAECIKEGARDGQFKLMLHQLKDKKRYPKFENLVIK